MPRGTTIFHDRAFNRLTTFDLWVEGAPLFADSKTIQQLRAVYMAVDERYRGAIKDRAGKPVNIRREHRRAWDRARQEIDRAFDDLVTIYAADEVVDPATGKTIGYRIYRLPEVRRRQLEHGAEFALSKPGGGLIVVDRAGFDVGHQRRVNPSMVQQPETQIVQAVVERNDNAQDDPELRSGNTDTGSTLEFGERSRSAA